jgi:CRP-like cAMP-binding protein
MDEGRPILEKLTAKTQRVNTHQDIIHEGDEPDNLYLIIESFACRCQILPGGKPPIMAHLVHGDLYYRTCGATASDLCLRKWRSERASV